MPFLKLTFAETNLPLRIQKEFVVFWEMDSKGVSVVTFMAGNLCREAYVKETIDEIDSQMSASPFTVEVQGD